MNEQFNDFHFINGKVVTERITRICAEKGHATYKVNGHLTGICPRCGEVTVPALSHDRRCITNSMIAALENWRDDQYSTEVEFTIAVRGSLLATAEGYLNDGLMTCICKKGE